MNKTFLQSKTNWVAVLTVVLGTLAAIDPEKLPEQVKAWAVPVIGLLTLIARNSKSNIGNS